MKTCFLIGSRDWTDRIVPALDEAVERHIAECGVTEFVVGGYGNFDRMAAAALSRAKERHPQIVLTLLLPYHPSERMVPLPKGFDGTFYPPEMERVPRRFAISKANRWMINHSDFLIAAPLGVGNSRDLTEYALRRQERGLLQVTVLTEKSGRP